MKPNQLIARDALARGGKSLMAGTVAMLGAARAPKPKMNGLERDYAELLEANRQSGVIEWWKFEGMTLKLADDTRYTPDFVVKYAHGGISFHETKGFMRGAARVRLNVAAAMFPFPFYLVKRVDGAWFVTVVNP